MTTVGVGRGNVLVDRIFLSHDLATFFIVYAVVVTTVDIFDSLLHAALLADILQT